MGRDPSSKGLEVLTRERERAANAMANSVAQGLAAVRKNIASLAAEIR